MKMSCKDDETLGMAMMLFKLELIDQIQDCRPLEFVFASIRREKDE
jgi:hypothetical protein